MEQNNEDTNTSIIMNRPDPFRYHDPTQFFTDFLNHLKLTDQTFSIRSLARDSEISVGYISNILHGKRRLTTKGLEKIAKRLPLSRAEHAYIIRLSQATLSTELEDRTEALTQLQRFRQYCETNPKDSELFRYFSRWYHLAIREMSSLPDFRLDPKWIQSRLKFPVKFEEVESALEFLTASGFIQVDKSKKVHAPVKRLEAHSAVLSVAMSQFHQQTLELASGALTSTPKDERLYLAHSFAISDDEFQQAQVILKEALDKISKLGGSSESRSVYQCSMTLFPLTRKPAGDQNEN